MVLTSRLYSLSTSVKILDSPPAKVFAVSSLQQFHRLSFANFTWLRFKATISGGSQSCGVFDCPPHRRTPGGPWPFLASLRGVVPCPTEFVPRGSFRGPPSDQCCHAFSPVNVFSGSVQRVFWLSCRSLANEIYHPISGLLV